MFVFHVPRLDLIQSISSEFLKQHHKTKVSFLGNYCRLSFMLVVIFAFCKLLKNFSGVFSRYLAWWCKCWEKKIRIRVGISDVLMCLHTISSVINPMDKFITTYISVLIHYELTSLGFDSAETSVSCI